MESNQIVNEIESGKFTKAELVSIAEACATAISERNHNKSSGFGDKYDIVIPA